MRSLEDWLDKAREVLSAVGADPVVIGALAAIRYSAKQRETTDVDFLVRRVEGLREALERLGLEIKEGKDPSGPPYAYFLEGEVGIDVLIAETDYQDEAIARAIDGFLTPEDVILHKLLAWRPRDRDDVDSIIAGGRKLDADYIERWASEWDVLDRWREIRG